MTSRILIVDDDEQDRALYQAWLSDEYEITEATNGEDGVRKCLETPPACVIMDFMMSGSDGFQALIELRKMLNSEVPIIFTTDYGNKEVEEDALALGATAYIPKSELSSTQLKETLINAIEAAQL